MLLYAHDSLQILSVAGEKHELCILRMNTDLRKAVMKTTFVDFYCNMIKEPVRTFPSSFSHLVGGAVDVCKNVECSNFFFANNCVRVYLCI